MKLELRLSDAELEVLKYVADGKRPSEIKVLVDATENAVNMKIYSVKNKLGANTSAGMVARAFRLGVLRVEGESK